MFKTNHQKRIMKKYLAFIVLAFLVPISSQVWSFDDIASTFTSQTSISSGSNASQIQVNEDLSYVNKWNNSSVIWNSLQGYYHDSVLWYFKVNWSQTASQNVRIVGSTSLCTNSYGYKLWGYSYSEYYGFMDFDYSDEIFVYYCDSSKSLQGYAYNSDLWLQSFEWITFDIEVKPTTIAQLPVNNLIFVNDATKLISPRIPIFESSVSNEWWINDVFIGADEIEFEAIQESLFYIIK